MYGRIIALVGTALVGTGVAVGKKISKSIKDKNNYDEKGYNQNGCDINGYDKSYYQQELSEIKSLFSEAYNYMQNRDFYMSLKCIRECTKKSMVCILCHWKKGSHAEKINSNTLECNIGLCEGIFTDDFTRKLYEIKRYCGNSAVDQFRDIQNNQLYFCYKTLEELIGSIEMFCN